MKCDISSIVLKIETYELFRYIKENALSSVTDYRGEERRKRTRLPRGLRSVVKLIFLGTIDARTKT